MYIYIYIYIHKYTYISTRQNGKLRLLGTSPIQTTHFNLNLYARNLSFPNIALFVSAGYEGHHIFSGNCDSARERDSREINEKIPPLYI